MTRPAYRSVRLHAGHRIFRFVVTCIAGGFLIIGVPLIFHALLWGGQ